MLPHRVPAALLTAVLLAAGPALAADLPKITKVELQPLGEQAKRIVTAMEERGMIGPERGGKQREVFEIDMEGGAPAEESAEEAGIRAFPE